MFLSKGFSLILLFEHFKHKEYINLLVSLLSLEILNYLVEQLKQMVEGDEIFYYVVVFIILAINTIRLNVFWRCTNKKITHRVIQ